MVWFGWLLLRDFKGSPDGENYIFLRLIYLVVLYTLHSLNWLARILSIVWILQNLLGHLFKKTLGNSFQKSLGDLDYQLILQPTSLEACYY